MLMVISCNSQTSRVIHEIDLHNDRYFVQYILVPYKTGRGQYYCFLLQDAINVGLLFFNIIETQFVCSHLSCKYARVCVSLHSETTKNF